MAPYIFLNPILALLAYYLPSICFKSLVIALTGECVSHGNLFLPKSLLWSPIKQEIIAPVSIVELVLLSFFLSLQID